MHSTKMPHYTCQTPETHTGGCRVDFELAWGMSWQNSLCEHIRWREKKRKTTNSPKRQKVQCHKNTANRSQTHRHEFCKPGGSIRSPSSGFCVFPRCAGDFEPRIQWWRVRLLWMALRPDNTSHCLFSMTEAGLWCSVLSWLPLLRAGLGCESGGEQERSACLTVSCYCIWAAYNTECL